MPRQPELHPHSDRTAFTRLMLLIATLLRYPGVGCPAPETSSNSQQHHNALERVRDRLLELAEELSLELPTYSVPSLRKDLETLRDYGVLEQRMYRWGYYLGTGALNQQELAAALDALRIQAQVQGDPRLKKMLRQLKLRLRGLDLALDGELFYPVRAQLNQLIIHTDPEEMRRLGEYRETLFDSLEIVEGAIAQGQALELYERGSTQGKSPSARPPGPLAVYPLQLLYHEVAWYLLYEDCESGHLAIRRLDRWSSRLAVLAKERERSQQMASLKVANRLLQEGWGLFLGEPEAQRLERLGKTALVIVKVRFFEEVAHFIVEGERRHPRQQIRLGPKNEQGRWEYVDYSVRLPERSLPEFFRWVNRFLEQSLVLAPQDWVERYRTRVQRMAQNYGIAGTNCVDPGILKEP